MKKLINVLSIISVALAGASILFMVAALTFLWEPLAELFGYPIEYFDDIGPIVPISNVFSVVVSFIVALVLLITPKQIGSVAVEFVIIGILATAMPALAYCFSYVQLALVNSLGIDVISAFSITRNILSTFSQLTSLATTLCFVTMGMRIAEKFNYKRQFQNQ